MSGSSVYFCFSARQTPFLRNKLKQISIYVQLKLISRDELNVYLYNLWYLYPCSFNGKVLELASYTIDQPHIGYWSVHFRESGPLRCCLRWMALMYSLSNNDSSLFVNELNLPGQVNTYDLLNKVLVCLYIKSREERILF